MGLTCTKNEKDTQFFDNVHAWDAGKKYQKIFKLVNRHWTCEMKKELSTLWNLGTLFFKVVLFAFIYLDQVLLIILKKIVFS